jgi:anaerobic magnesium-protoporphyrin IX monomethyl ester cyclase
MGVTAMSSTGTMRVALIEAGSPGLNIYSHIAMGRGVPLLATVLRDAGYDVRAFVEDISGKGSVDWEFVRTADAVGFSAITCTLTRTAELVAETRRLVPGAPIILGGPEPTCAPERAFEAGADYVIRGEAEFSLPQLLEALRNHPHSAPPDAVLQDIPGIIWREREGPVFGPPPVQLTRAELSALPLIDMSLVEGSENRTTGLVWRSRGCPHRCAFCEVHEIWPRYVLRDEERSVDELIACQSEGQGNVFLIDDNAAADKPSFKEFLRGAIERGYAGSIAIQLRADAVFDRFGHLDKELLRLLHDLAPMTMLCIGVESSEDTDLDKIGKHASSDRVAAAISAMRRRGLLVHGMLIAFAGDTAETLKRNGRFARKYFTSLQYLFETPLPGTKSTAEYEAAGRVLFHEVGHLKFLDGMHVAIRPERMSAKEMQELVTAEYKAFYSPLRITRAFLAGLLLRHRRLGPGQRRYLHGLPPAARLREWAWMHLQFKFAPWAVLRTGRQRVQAFLEDAEYGRYLDSLEG